MSNKSFFAVPTMVLLLAGCASPATEVPAAAGGYGQVEFSSQVLSRTIQYASGDVRSCKVFLLAPDNTTVSSGVVLADGTHYSNGHFTYAMSNVPPGNYKASIEFYNGDDPATSTKIGSGASVDANDAEQGDFTVVAGQTATVGFGSVTLDPNPVGNANASVTVNGATEAIITFQ